MLFNVNSGLMQLSFLFAFAVTATSEAY